MPDDDDQRSELFVHRRKFQHIQWARHYFLDFFMGYSLGRSRLALGRMERVEENLLARKFKSSETFAKVERQVFSPF